MADAAIRFEDVSQHGRESQRPADEVVRTTCRFCLVRCGMRVYREGGAVVKIDGDPDHPLSKGFLCVKGRASLDIAHSPHRLSQPLRRAGERGSGQWTPVSWNEALDDIAARLREIIQRHGGRAISTQSLPPKDAFVYDLFAKLVGATVFKHDSHQCFTPQIIADRLTFGRLATYPSFDDENLADARCVVAWGVNFHATNPSKGVWVEAARKRGADVIVMDPRPILAARRASLWLRVRPGTDAILALGMLHVILTEGLFDAAFVRQWTHGFDQLRDHVRPYTSEHVSQVTWVPAEDIVAAARMYARAKPAALFTFIGTIMGGNCIDTVRALGLLVAVTGNVDVRGGNRLHLPPPIRIGRYGDLRSETLLGAEKFPLFSGPEAMVTPYAHPAHVIKAMLEGDPYPIRALWTDCNPVVAVENTGTIVAALKKLDLLVVSELFMTPTAHLADYVLPITMHLESDAITEYSGLPYVSARQKAMDPRGEAREEGEAVLEVLRRMGYADQLPADSHRGLLDYRLQPAGVDFDEFARRVVVRGQDVERKYERGLLRRDGQPGFDTPTGKIELFSTVLERYGYRPLPVHQEPYSNIRDPEELAREYPLIMISGTRSIHFYSTMGLEVERLRRTHPDPLLELSPECAELHGIQNGDWVWIESPWSSRRVRRKARVTAGMHERVVNAEGLWYLPGEDPVESALAVGANTLTLLSDAFDPVVGGSMARCVPCRIGRIESD